MKRGYRSVGIKTLNGFFKFLVRKYEVEGGVITWLSLTDTLLNAHHESQQLQSYCLSLVQDLSYEKSHLLLSQRMGNSSISAMRLCTMVKEASSVVKRQQEEQIKAYESTQMPDIEQVDIYDKEVQEVVYMSDGICVNEQKAKRDGVKKEGKERTTTDIMLLQQADKSYKTIISCEGIDAVALVKSEVKMAYPSPKKPVPIVCISDGARSIKTQNKAIFGENVVHILDYYHLQAKVVQLMSQIAKNKEIKQEMIALLMGFLWSGNVISAVIALKFLIPKNIEKRDELVGYLEKNQAYIIDYGRRQEAAKTIGSGRMEKANDCIIAKRQKRKAMAWSPRGSLDLAIITAYHKHVA